MIAEGINAMAEEAHETSTNSGFHDNENDWSNEMTLARIALVHTELSEFVDEFRKEFPDPRLLAEELADAIIRIGDLAKTHDLDLGEAVVKKMAKNKTRPYKHGKRI